jgi:hypothetical protein
MSTERRHYRQGAQFVMNPAALSTKLTGNQRAKILHACEVMERKSKGKGCRNGVLGIPAMMILRCLLMRFHNRKTGLCYPSYDALQAVTGLCRQSIAVALDRLERAGVLRITRRMVRIAGELGGIICQQSSNLYAFAELPGQLDLGATTRPRLALPNPRVYEADGNPKPEVYNRRGNRCTGAFSYEAIAKRRAQAGLR